MSSFGILIALKVPASSARHDEMQRKLRAAHGPVLDIDGRTVQFGNALHDGQTSPVLPCWLRSRRQKRRKISSRSSCEIPGPRSSTVTVPFSSTTNSTTVSFGACLMAFSARLRIARLIISALPLTHTGAVEPSNAISLPCSSASGAMNPATSAQAPCRSATSDGSIVNASSSAMSSNWPTTRLIASMSSRSALATRGSSSVSTRVRKMLSGVRSSWAASAVNSR